MRLSDIPRSANRARINDLANGVPPYSVNEQTDNNLDTNVNFLEVAKALWDGRKTWANAFLKAGVYFKVSVDSKNRRAATWGHKITAAINKVLKRSLAYTELIQATGAQVLLHGVGPSWWEDKFAWRPEEVGIEDLLIPSGTRKSFSNLSHFPIFRKYTAGQLYRMTHGNRRDPGWNMRMVNAELTRLAGEYYNAALTAVDMDNPEKLAEFYKANSGYMDSDAVPTINTWDFYWQGEKDEEGKWHRAIIIDSPQGAASEEGDFLYKSPKPMADKWQHILHVNFGDGANKAPFLYHSIRSLGFLLYGPGHLQNRVRCRINDAIFENSVMGFRVQNAEDRARVTKIDLFQKGIMLVPQGVEIIPESERRSINQELVFAGLAQNRQLMAEASAQYTQDVEQGTTREQTATEVMAKVNSANALVSGMLLSAYEYQTHQYIEICRRFCLKNSTDPDVKKFQQQMKNEGVPEEALDVEKWNVEPERVLGAGNKMLEIAEAQKLMEIRNLLEPDKQQEVLHIYVEAVTSKPELADRLAPMAPPPISNSRHDGQLAAGAIMQGLPVQTRPGTNHIDYVEALLSAMAATLKLIQATGGMASKDQVIGLGSLAQAIQAELAQISQDDNEKERVRQYQDALSQMMNLVKGYVQQLQKQMQEQGQNNGQDAELRAKLAAMVVQAQSKAQIAEANAALKRQHKNISFVEDQKRQDIQTALDARRDLAQSEVDAAATDIKTAADIRAKRAAMAGAGEIE